MDADLQLNRRRNSEADDKEDEEEDEEEAEKDDDEAKEAQLERYNEFLVKKDINDYFAQSKNAANEEEVFDRSERAGAEPDSSGKHSVDWLID